MDQITQDIIDGTPFATLRRNVSQIPSELGELYRLTIQRIKSTYHAEAWIMFQAVLCALEPLSLEALAGLTHRIVKSSYPSEVSLQALRSESGLAYPRYVLQERLRWLNSRSGGLLEAVSFAHDHGAEPEESIESDHSDEATEISNSSIESSASEAPGFVIQFIHQTVKDSLVQYGIDLGFNKEPKDITGTVYDASGFEFLMCACSGEVKWASRLCAYALTYAKLAEQSAGTDAARISRIVFVTRISLEYNRRTIKVAMNEIRDAGTKEKLIELDGWLGNASEVHMLAVTSNLVHTVKDLPSLDGTNETKLGARLLCLAIIGPIMIPYENCDIKCSEMIKALIGIGCAVDSSTSLPPSAYHAASRVESGSLMSPLDVVCVNYQFESRRGETELDVARTLILEGAEVDSYVDVYYGHIYGKTHGVHLVEYCARYGSAKWVRFLLQYLSSDDEAEWNRDRALGFAHLRHDGDIIQAFNDYGYTCQNRVRSLVPDAVGDSVLAVGEMLLGATGGVGANLQKFRIVSPVM